MSWGHFWGLGHEFSRDARGRTLHPSTLGFEGIGSWATAAILAFYLR